MISAPAPHENCPIFVVGSARSGTTLMTHVLMQSGEFPIYQSETQIMPSVFAYGAIDRRRSRDRFVADFLRSRQFARSGLREDELRRMASDCRDYSDFLARFMDAIARSQDKARWVEKTPGHTRFLLVLARRFPTARFLHVIRDGRDVALSRRKLGWTPGFGGNRFLQLLWAGRQWGFTVSRARRHAIGLGERYLEVRYEDLVRDADRTLTQVAHFADIELAIREDRNKEFGSQSGPNTAFGDTTGVVAGQAVERWKHQMALAERERLTWALRRQLEEFGYEVPATQLSRSDRMVTGSTAGLVSVSDAVKEWLRENTPLGHRTASPLEIGLK